MRNAVLTSLIIVAATVSVVRADAEVVLLNGQVVRGVDVRRDGGEYLVTLESEETIALPIELVEAVRLSETEPRILAGQPPPEGPSGVKVSEPETLAGTPVEPPKTSEQLEVFGEPAEFPSTFGDSGWAPREWEMDSSQNDFNPSTWAESPADPTWEPESAWPADRDVLEASRSTWQKSITDPTWTPTDGFKR